MADPLLKRLADCLTVLIIIVVFSVILGVVIILAINLCVKKHLDKLILAQHVRGVFLHPFVGLTGGGLGGWALCFRLNRFL